VYGCSWHVVDEWGWWWLRMDGEGQWWCLWRICRHAGRCRRELNVGGNLVYVGGLIVVELAEGGDFMEQCLEC
jgi:hypothetical protein